MKCPHTNSLFSVCLLICLGLWANVSNANSDNEYDYDVAEFLSEDDYGQQAEENSKFLLASVYHLTRVKVIESSSPIIRPYSVYDIKTIFETLPGLSPKFNYYIQDAGLGSEEAIYPIYQKGKMKSWFQTLPWIIGKVGRTDLYSITETMEGCKIWTYYNITLLEHTPQNKFVLEKQEDYKFLVRRFEHYQRTNPLAQCGRHWSHDSVDMDWDPFKILRPYRKVLSLSELPKSIQDKFEIKISTTKYLETVTGKNEVSRIDTSKQKSNKNSLYYDPKRIRDDFRVSASFPQPYANQLQKAEDTIYSATLNMRQNLKLKNFITHDDFQTLIKFVSGLPESDYKNEHEPGRDTLDINKVTPDFIWTYGLGRRPITENVSEVISNMNNYQLVGVIFKPYENESDIHFPQGKIIPQTRFVFQLTVPGIGPVEQFFLHLNYDAITNRLDTDNERAGPHRDFLLTIERIAMAKKTGSYEKTLIQYISELIKDKNLENLAFSSSLTGTWVFGQMSAVDNSERRLLPLRQKRMGLDFGYYSSVYDNDVIQSAAKSLALDENKKILDVRHYRDSIRMNVEKINFNSTTCFQCHQIAGKDSIFIKFHDGVDKRDLREIQVGEFIWREAERQLKFGTSYWK